MDTNLKIKSLRKIMKSQQISTYMIGTADPHQSEYPPQYWASREWITGFTGSAGTAVITSNHAGLWTDSRYYLQAEHELAGTEFELAARRAWFDGTRTPTRSTRARCCS